MAQPLPLPFAVDDDEMAQARPGQHRTLGGPALPASPTPAAKDDPPAPADPRWRPIIPAWMRIPAPVPVGSQPHPVPTPVGTPVSPPPLQYAGVPAASREAGWLNPSTLWLAVPHRSQHDGTLYAETNCGPASLAMVLEAYGLEDYSTDALRGEVNRLQGNSDPGQGTSLAAIALVAQRGGLVPLGLYSSSGLYRRWTIEELRLHLAQGRPIITLTRYADLPTARGLDPRTNHYIVLSGLSGDELIYNESALPQVAGAGLLISPEALQRAWENSSIPGHAVAFALDASGAGLLEPGRLSRLPERPPGPHEELEGDLRAASLGAALEKRAGGSPLAPMGWAGAGLHAPIRSGADTSRANIPPQAAPEIEAYPGWAHTRLGIFILAVLAPGILAAYTRARHNK